MIRKLTSSKRKGRKARISDGLGWVKTCQGRTVGSSEEKGVNVRELEVRTGWIFEGCFYRREGDTEFVDASLSVLSTLSVPTSVRQAPNDALISAFLVLPRLLLKCNGTSNTTNGVAELVTGVAG